MHTDSMNAWDLLDRTAGSSTRWVEAASERVRRATKEHSIIGSRNRLSPVDPDHRTDAGLRCSVKADERCGINDR